MATGRISALEPLSTCYGYDRGTPIDRFYIDSFVAENGDDIRGSVLEIGEDSYSKRFGGNRVSEQHVLHVHSGNEHATLVGDLADPATLPEGRFDCIVMTQTLQLVFDQQQAIGNIHRALRPGGVLLLTVAGLTPVCEDEWQESFYWMFTPRGLRRLLGTVFENDRIDIRAFGNLYAATAFLHGAAVQEVRRKKLDLSVAGPEYPIVIAARATT